MQREEKIAVPRVTTIFLSLKLTRFIIYECFLFALSSVWHGLASLSFEFLTPLTLRNLCHRGQNVRTLRIHFPFDFFWSFALSFLTFSLVFFLSYLPFSVASFYHLPPLIFAFHSPLANHGEKIEREIDEMGIFRNGYSDFLSFLFFGFCDSFFPYS